jgi:hypothetical protein
MLNKVAKGKYEIKNVADVQILTADERDRTRAVTRDSIS